MMESVRRAFAEWIHQPGSGYHQGGGRAADVPKGKMLEIKMKKQEIYGTKNARKC